MPDDLCPHCFELVLPGLHCGCRQSEATRKKPRLKWMHPAWDKFLITDLNFRLDDLKTNDFLVDDDPALVTVESVYMTDQEVEDLGEWDG